MFEQRHTVLIVDDYYDALHDHTERLWIALGDVTGKGVPAALTMATLRTLFHAELERDQPLPVVMRRVDDGLGNCTPDEVFATFCCGILDPERTTLTLINAGHPCPMVVHADGSVEEIKEAGPPVGFDPIMTGQVHYTEQEIALNPGEMMVLYSDGVSEALNAQGELFGEQRIAGILRDHREKTSGAMIETIIQAASSFQGKMPQSNDITLMAIKAV
jgi:sigma-B regulation protein RsbU (phosphoserine phosphatase)